MNSKIQKGFLVSLSGFDGVGKSTQVKLLLKYLEGKGKKVKVTEAMFGYFLLKPLVKVLRRATNNVHGGPVKRNKSILPKLWFILAFIDIWVSFIFKTRSWTGKYDFVIADRFYTDIWANLLYYGYLPDWAFAFFVKLLPKPDIAFILRAKPNIVLKREREFPNRYYNEQEKIYLRLADQVEFNIVDASQSPGVVSREINRKVVEYLGL